MGAEAGDTPDLSIVIANYNTAHYLMACIDAIKQTAPRWLNYEIIVVDNASTDGSVSELCEAHPDVAVITNSQNVGFSAANNQAISRSRGRLVLFLNPDTVVHADTLGHMVRFMDSVPAAGAATCRVELPDGRLDDGSHRGFPTPWNALCYFSGLSRVFPRSELFSGYTLGWMDMDAVHEIDALVGAFMLVPRVAGDAVGWWDEDYFFYGEDLDFCYKLKQAGWAILFVPTTSATHLKGASSGIKKQSAKAATANRETKERSTRARFDAMRIFYGKHYVDTYPRIVTSLVLRAIDLKEWTAMRGIEPESNP